MPPATPGTLPPNLPRRVDVVGDSQANALVKNAPLGLGSTLALDERLDRRLRHRRHRDIRTVAHFRRAFGDCEGWPDEVGGVRRRARPDHTGRARSLGGVRAAAGRQRWWRSGLRHAGRTTPTWAASCSGASTAIKGAGSKVALLEIPCYDPVDGGGLDRVARAG